jgi:hypothetical protein
MAIKTKAAICDLLHVLPAGFKLKKQKIGAH